MIRRDRNHPSIMLWSMGSETNHAVDSKFAIAEDSTRILTACRVSDGSEGAFVKHTDQTFATGDISRCIIRGWTTTGYKRLNLNNVQNNDIKGNKSDFIKVSGASEAGNIGNWLL